MSHFNVLVLTTENSPSLEELLEPYFEGNARAPYIVFTKQQAIDHVRKHYPNDFNDKSDEECWKFMTNDYIADKNGDLYTTSNPDAKWDYWDEEGRNTNILKLKGSGKKVNSAKIKEIDFSLDEDVYHEALRFWDVIVEHEPLEPEEKKPLSLYDEQYYRELYGNRESFAKYMASFSTYAVVTSNGIWHESAPMDCFGISSETPEKVKEWHENYLKNFIENEDGDTVITVVDCHI